MNGHANASGYYEPAEDGKAAFIIAAQILEKIVDFVAFRLGDEDHFWRRRAVLGLLGLPVADWCYAMGASLAVSEIDALVLRQEPRELPTIGDQGS